MQLSVQSLTAIERFVGAAVVVPFQPRADGGGWRAAPEHRPELVRRVSRALASVGEEEALSELMEHLDSLEMSTDVEVHALPDGTELISATEAVCASMTVRDIAEHVFATQMLQAAHAGEPIAEGLVIWAKAKQPSRANVARRGAFEAA